MILLLFLIIIIIIFIIVIIIIIIIIIIVIPRANGAKRRSGRKPGARVTNFALGKFKVIAHGS